MDEARHLLLAAAVLARQQDPAFRGRHQGHVGHEPLHGGTVGQEEAAALHFGQEPLVLQLQLKLAQGIAHDQQETVQVDGLFQEVEGAQLGGLQRGVDACMT